MRPTAIKYCIKTHSLVLNDATNKYYSDPELNAALGSAEKFFVQARGTNVSGTNPSLQIQIETSADGINWVLRSTPISFTLLSLGPNLFGSELGTSSVGGRFMRVSAQLGGTAPNVYVEVWVCGRSAI